jgi:hypothetical protein
MARIYTDENRIHEGGSPLLAHAGVKARANSTSLETVPSEIRGSKLFFERDALGKVIAAN